jgi:hypothetical protein
MSNRTCTAACAFCAIALTGYFQDAAAQRRAPNDAAATQKVDISLKVGAQTYQASASGHCTYAPTASIYQIVSEMWTVQHSADGRSVALSVWKPKDGSRDMFSLSAHVDKASYDVTTVRGGASAGGSGKITFAKTGAGGTFTIDARAKDGSAIGGTIRCDSFAPHIAEGGA